MNILWLKAGGFVPADTGGKLRSFHMASELAQRHAVTLFTFYSEHPNDQHEKLHEPFADVIALPLRLPGRQSLREIARYASLLFTGQPYTMRKYYVPELRRRIETVLAERRFDAIICDFIYPAGLLDWRLPCPKILFTHNVEARPWERLYRVTSNWLWKAAAFVEFKTLTRAERTYVRLADHVLTVSEVDRQFFAQYVPAERITALPTGVDIDFHTPVPGEELDGAIVFTGSMDWMPNEDGIEWFLKEVFPIILQKAPDAVLWVVGRNPSERLQALAQSNRSVRITGRVDDIRPYIRRGSVYVVPLRSGSGTRLKIFEAMATGKAIVSTTLGAEGLPVEDGTDIVLADDAESFARETVELLRDGNRRRALGLAARARVAERHGWASVTEKLESVLLDFQHHPDRELAAGARPARAER
jgi:sugar transferase (PEP-CTERM/EpsH1 system associated)